MTVYFTTDADEGRIPERADISKAATMEEALEACRAAYTGSDFEVVELEAGHFGDCWIKVHDRRTLEAKVGEWTDEAGELIVQEPGSHPGGKAFWLTPAADVYVPVLREVE